MALEHLSVAVPLPETDGDRLGFHPDHYVRSPEEIAMSEQILAEQLEIARIQRKQVEQQYEHTAGWLSKTVHYRLQGGLIGLLCGAVLLIGILLSLGWIAIR